MPDLSHLTEEERQTILQGLWDFPHLEKYIFLPYDLGLSVGSVLYFRSEFDNGMECLIFLFGCYDLMDLIEYNCWK